MKKIIPYLCGGTLFNLILQARKRRTKVREKTKGEKDGLNECELMNGLVYIVTGDDINDNSSNFRKSTTSYKTCKENNNSYIDFLNQTTVISFDTAVRRNDKSLKTRIIKFIEKYISNSKYEILAKMILELIQQDIEIDINTKFLKNDNEYFEKKDIEKLTELDLPSFLLSVLHYIVLYRQDNTKGRETFVSWHEQSIGRGKWKFISDIGKSLKQAINIRIEENIELNDNKEIVQKVKKNKTKNSKNTSSQKDIWKKLEKKYKLSKEALIILAYASETQNNCFVITKITYKSVSMNGIEYNLSVNGKDLTDENSKPREIMAWIEAIEQLEENNFIEDMNYKREIYILKKIGFDIGDMVRTKLNIDTNLPPKAYL